MASSSSHTSLSKFEQKQKRRQADIDSRVQEYKAMLAKLTSEQLESHRIEADKVVDELESGRKLDRIIAHIDMDAFFASVEMRDNPELCDKPIAVGSKWMLSTANYAARKYGVRSGMPGFKAQKLCPQLVIVTVDISKYADVSAEVRRVLERFDPNLEHSLDEAYLDLTDYIQRRIAEERPTFDDHNDTNTGSDESNANVIDNEAAKSSCASSVPLNAYDRFVSRCVADIRASVLKETRLTCSSGIAANCMLAKLCSDMNKPNGQFYLRADRNCIVPFIRDQRIGKVCGIGPVTERTLNGLDINTVGDLFEKRGELHALFADPRTRPQRAAASSAGSGWSSFDFYMRVALGLGSTELTGIPAERKSLSVERTFVPTENMEELCATLRSECDEVLDELRGKQLKGRTVTVKIKFDSFDVCTRAITVDRFFGASQPGSNSNKSTGDDADQEQAAQLYVIAKQLLQAELTRRSSSSSTSVRLLGLRISNLVSVKEESQETRVTNSQPLITELLGRSKSRAKSRQLEPAASASNSRSSFVDDECSNSKFGDLDGAITHHRRFDIDENTCYSFEQTNSDFGSASDIELHSNYATPRENCEPTNAASASETCTSSSLVRCPVCDTAVKTGDDLVAFNRHMDECLNESAIGSTDGRRHNQHQPVVVDLDATPEETPRPDSSKSKSGNTQTRKRSAKRTTKKAGGKRTANATSKGGPLDKFLIPCIEIDSDTDSNPPDSTGH